MRTFLYIFFFVRFYLFVCFFSRVRARALREREWIDRFVGKEQKVELMFLRHYKKENTNLLNSLQNYQIIDYLII